MVGKNSTPLIGWHSADSTLKPWLEDEVKRRRMGTMRELLDEMAAEYRERVEFLKETARTHPRPEGGISATGTTQTEEK